MTGKTLWTRYGHGYIKVFHSSEIFEWQKDSVHVPMVVGNASTGPIVTIVIDAN